MLGPPFQEPHWWLAFWFSELEILVELDEPGMRHIGILDEQYVVPRINIIIIIVLKRMIFEGLGVPRMAPISQMSKFNDFYLMEKDLVFSGWGFSKDGLYFYRTFLLENVLIKLDGFVRNRGAVMLLDSISGMKGKI